MVEEEKKRIVIRVDGDHQRGMGHLFRMKTLANEFRKQHVPYVFVIRKNDKSKQILHDAQHPYLEYPTEHREDDIIEDYFLDNVMPTLWTFDIMSTQGDWVRRVKRHGPLVVCFDDLKGGLEAADLVINAIAGCWEAEKRPSSLGVRVLNGPGYAIIDPEILKVRRRDRTPKGPIRIGVTMGGSDTHGATVQVAKVLSELKEELEATFFLGPHFMHVRELENVLEGLPFPSVTRTALPRLHKELIKSDLVICGGGQTLFELCAMGMCTAAVANEAHEEKTISCFVKHGACIDIGSVHDGIAVARLAETVAEVESESRRIQDLRSNARGLVDGQGLYRCAMECLQIEGETKGCA
jgi:spore coat polysaccharide biosynthesis predicted glycosyltransferase SpsG